MEAAQPKAAASRKSINPLPDHKRRKCQYCEATILLDRYDYHLLSVHTTANKTKSPTNRTGVNKMGQRKCDFCSATVKLSHYENHVRKVHSKGNTISTQGVASAKQRHESPAPPSIHIAAHKTEHVAAAPAPTATSDQSAHEKLAAKPPPGEPVSLKPNVDQRTWVVDGRVRQSASVGAKSKVGLTQRSGKSVSGTAAKPKKKKKGKNKKKKIKAKRAIPLRAWNKNAPAMRSVQGGLCSGR